MIKNKNAFYPGDIVIITSDYYDSGIYTKPASGPSCVGSLATVINTNGSIGVRLLLNDNTICWCSRDDITHLV